MNKPLKEILRTGTKQEAITALRKAWSCDLLPSEKCNLSHFKADCLTFINEKWDMIIAHPPCTFLCNSGVRWLAPKGILNAERHTQMKAACDLFAALYNAPASRICIENPIMHKYARDYLQSAWKVPKFTQSIQPWQFGHGEIKRTCLWLRGLPLLKPTNIVPGREPRVHHASPSADRWRERSRTLTGIAEAMAEQWG